MTCKAYETHLIEKCEGTLSETLTRELEIHLSGCSLCQEELKDLEDIWGHLNQLKKVTPRAPLFYFSTLLSRTRARIRREAGEEISFLEKIRNLLRLPQLAPIALSVLILVLTFSNQIEDQYHASHQDQYVITLAMGMNALNTYAPSLIDTYETLDFLNSQQIETLIKSLEQKLEVTS